MGAGGVERLVLQGPADVSSQERRILEGVRRFAGCKMHVCGLVWCSLHHSSPVWTYYKEFPLVKGSGVGTQVGQGVFINQKELFQITCSLKEDSKCAFRLQS